MLLHDRISRPGISLLEADNELDTLATDVVKKAKGCVN
jgi:hypothetical protein